MTFQKKRAFHIGGASWLLLCAAGNGAMAQNAAPAPSSTTALPEITVTAPRDGVVKAIHCVEGELVQPGVELITLNDE